MSWKDSIISDPPSEEEDKELPDNDDLKDLKSQIVELVDDGHNSREELISLVDKPREDVLEAIALLKGENVLVEKDYEKS